MRRIGKMLFLTALTIGILTSCMQAKTNAFNPDRNSIFLHRDGRISSALLEEVGEGNYTSEGLREYAMTEVDEFNAKYGEGTVSLDTAKIENNKATLIYTYKDFTSLQEFTTETQNENIKAENIRILPMTEAANSDIATLIPEKYARKEKLYVGIVEGGGYFITEGKILYAVSGKDISFQEYDVALEDGKTILIFE